MTTEAQVQANRANAQKSTGPRTPEGKATVAQNALKHGLLAKDAVVAGEDLDEFDLLRDQLRAELAPATLTESLLIERIAGLSWRLRRAERFGTEAFDMLYVQCAAEPQSQRWRPGPEPGAADPVVGLTVIKDFSETKVLERLLICERRIENSLYRTMAELRQVQEQRQAAADESRWDRRRRRSRREEDRGEPFHRVPETLPPDFTLDNLLAKIAALEEPPAGATTNTPAAEGHSCETKPISGTAGWDEAAGARDEGQSCETKPISGSPCGTGIPSAALSAQALPVSLDHRQDGDPKRDLSRLGTHADATVPPTGGTTNLAPAQSQSCETNPISAPPTVDAPAEPVRSVPVRAHPGSGIPSASLSAPALPREIDQGQICETKPIAAAAKRERFGYTPIFRRRR